MTYEMEQMLKDEARRNIHEFIRTEYGEDARVNPDDTFIPIAYSTIDDSTGFEHIWQAYADLNRVGILHCIDGMFEVEDRYHDLASFVEDVLGCLEWDWLYRDGCTIVEVFEAQGKFEEV